VATFWYYSSQKIEWPVLQIVHPNHLTSFSIETLKAAPEKLWLKNLECISILCDSRMQGKFFNVDSDKISF
jgi:hypothetical protein